MKRKDLKVGEAYWYSRSNDWLERESAGMRLVVVDTGFWRIPGSSMWDRDRTLRPDTQGSGVLVDLDQRNFGTQVTTRRMVVNLTQIRGPYEETLKQVKEFDEKRKARLAKAEELRNETATKIQDAIARAAELGIKAKRAGYQLDEIALSTAEFVRLLNMIKEQQS